MHLFKPNTIIIKISLLFLCLNSYTFSYSQDIITKINGEKIKAKVELIEKDEIKYKRYNHLDGPSYIMEKNNINKIVFENGIIKSFGNDISDIDIKIEETKELIINTINKHGFERNSFKEKYKASFEGDYLKLIVLDKKGIAKSKEGILYDFSNVYKFHNVSERSDKKAFVNVWVSMLADKASNTWQKHKLIMRVDGIPEAYSILKALKQYNKLLLTKN
ncbi:hypothetical protein EGM88_06710 [Aureibaculum marinum]|uniref:Uncharacterized protein n=1 Tax=Aureibaculum marinum TaxID=2487930 RepID=A0A3N4NV31_9FLAO|nr:hypothetical protein [Aureibaculum marinum]RPD98178.1 hypothetical protein EGM88_06710 [Aureibaculum marinum]